MSHSSQTIRRGFDPDDSRWFSADAVALLRKAQEDVRWLLNRGYPMGSVTELVGGHYQLSARQRTALQRSTTTDRQCDGRQQKQLPLTHAKDDRILIDGFNLIILLEVALSGSLLILGMDGVLRDLAGLRGTYRLIHQTDRALSLIGQTLEKQAIPAAVFYLDANVSNSGRLRQRILEHALTWSLPVTVELVPNADTCLINHERVVTGDSFVLDGCISWFNLAWQIVSDEIPDAWIVRID